MTLLSYNTIVVCSFLTSYITTMLFPISSFITEELFIVYLVEVTKILASTIDAE